MIRGNLEKWTNVNGCINLLFFSQLVNELLFDYSIPSNRISTLNSHFLCYDAQNAIGNIVDNNLKEGSLKPIVDELCASVNVDPIFTDKKPNPLDYFIKNQNGRCRISQNVSDLSFDETRKAIVAIQNKFFNNDTYYKNLKTRIVELVVNNKVGDQPELFRLIKSVLCELRNYGYSQQYIYYIMDVLFWHSASSIDQPDVITSFFDRFPLEDQNHIVILILNKSKAKRLLHYFDKAKCQDSLDSLANSNSTNPFANKKKQNETYVLFETKAKDPYSAAEAIKYIINTEITFYKLYDHNFHLNLNNVPCAVLLDGNIHPVQRKRRATSHTKTPSMEMIRDGFHVAHDALFSSLDREEDYDFHTLLSAVNYHSQAIDSSFEGNQLVDLWAIFESVININSRHTSERISQVCTTLVPILKRRYLYSLFLQFSEDIKNYSMEKYNSIIGSSLTEKERVKAVCCFSLLDDHSNARVQFLQESQDFPLLCERLQYYNQKLHSPSSVYSFVEKHAQRVQWQIMRIYRNRNMTVHNGSSMPYLSLLIENLHSYVDDFLMYTIHSLAKGNTIETMCQELYLEECDWISCFSKNKQTLSEDLIEKMLAL